MATPAQTAQRRAHPPCAPVNYPVESAPKDIAERVSRKANETSKAAVESVLPSGPVIHHSETHDSLVIRYVSASNSAQNDQPRLFELEFSIPREERIALFKELMESIRGFAEKNAEMRRTKLKFLGLELDLLRRTASCDGHPIDLTHREFDILEYFLRRPERVLTRENILERVWGLNFEDQSNVLEVYLSKIRRKLGHNGSSPRIQTIRGLGYMLSYPKVPSGEVHDDSDVEKGTFA